MIRAAIFVDAGLGLFVPYFVCGFLDSQRRGVQLLVCQCVSLQASSSATSKNPGLAAIAWVINWGGRGYLMLMVDFQIRSGVSPVFSAPTVESRVDTVTATSAERILADFEK